MRLFVTRDFHREFHEDSYYIGTFFLKAKSTHFFIASNKWESIYIELEDSIPEGYLKSLHLVCPKITVNLPDKITDVTVRLLAELYPEKSGAIRRTYLTGGSLMEVLGECVGQYQDPS